MKKIMIIIGGLLLIGPFLAHATSHTPGAGPKGDGASGCGWGALLFDGNSGVGAHIFAVTTNNSFGNNTFGLSSGTNGCDADQTIRYRGGRMYIGANMTKLAEDMSRGNGETLAGLSEVMGIAKEDRLAFYALVKKHFAVIYPRESVTSDEVMDALIVVMKSDSALSKYVG